MTRRLLLCVGLLVVVLAGPALAQPLYDWINRPDPSYKWEKVSEKQLSGGLIWTELKLTSQTWQDIPWVHQVAIIRPAQLKTPDTAVLLINGGKLGPTELAMTAPIINGIGAPLVYLGDIPNQPLFHNLREDALIAHTYAQALKTKDMTWPLLFPMTKAAVRAMDCVQEYTAQAWPQAVRKFVVTGASKRGWTTWFTGCVDQKRVIGIAPMVYDNLNLPAQMAFQKSSYGVYSSQIDDYTVLGLPDLLQTPVGRGFGAAVDPYTYRQKITMPKLMIHGSNDPYWVVDSANIYWDDLVGRKSVLYIPNGAHQLVNGTEGLRRLLEAQVGFFMCCTGQAQFPQFTWRYEQGRYLKLHVNASPAPQQVLEWTATAPTRDFRPAKWTSRVVAARGGEYLLRLRPPASGYAAIFGEATFDLGGRQYPQSTQIQVLSAKQTE